jgi:hypothetical protein
MTALPPAGSEQVGNLEPNALSTYNVCLDFECAAAAKTDIDAIRARVLGYLILHAPSIHARHEVIKVIHSCAQKYDTLSELGQYFIDYFIRPCKLFCVTRENELKALPVKKYKGSTPVSESHPSCPSFDEDRMDLMVELQEAPKDHKTAKVQVGCSPFT